MSADGSKDPGPDFEALARSLARLAEESRRAWTLGLSQLAENAAAAGGIPRDLGQAPAEIASALDRLLSGAGATPGTEHAQDLLAAYSALWAGMMRRVAGEPSEPLPEVKDRRFSAPEWSDDPFYDFLRRVHLLTADWVERRVESADLDERTRRRIGFHLGEVFNALAPSNFLLTNPVLMRETRESQGANLARGLQMLAEDVRAGGGHLLVRQSEPHHFEVGATLAATAGKVVFRNELFELLQYAPRTAVVRRRPLLLVPPWINKFYILDLAPGRSFIEWAVGEGLTVFCMSWVNPDAALRDKTFDDYMRQGIITAAGVAREISGTETLDALGYCIGGTLLSVAAAALAQEGPSPFASLTLLAAQLDFTHAGDLKLFVEDGQLDALEQRMAERGFVEGQDLARAFNHLRSNELIWPFYVDVYLRGRPPKAVDFLYWNADTTRVPAANHAFYLRRCYLENALARGCMLVEGRPVDLRAITAPTYAVALRGDHIAPAASVFIGVQLLRSPVRFVLGKSGHIAGIINPPAKGKYGYWTGGAPKGDLGAWIGDAQEQPGSWWPDWLAWLRGLDSRTVKARKLGDRRHRPMEDAPGMYVHVRS